MSLNSLQMRAILRQVEAANAFILEGRLKPFDLLAWGERERKRIMRRQRSRRRAKRGWS